MWSVGCLLVEVASGRKLWRISNPQETGTNEMSQEVIERCVEERLEGCADIYSAENEGMFTAFKNLVLR